MTYDAFIKSSLKREDRLFSQVYAFNFLLSQYLHDSHLNFSELSPIWPTLSQSPRVQSRLSHYLLEHFNLHNNYFFDFSEPRLRLALVDSSTLQDLLLHAGSILYSDSMSKIILKKQVTQLKESIGDNIYFFAAKRAPLLKALAPKIETDVEPQNINKDTLLRAGQLCLELCFMNENDALLERIKLKFPSSMGWDFHPNAPQEQRVKAWNFLHRLLVKEIQPSYKSCFT